MKDVVFLRSFGTMAVSVYPHLDDYLLQHFDGSYYYFEPPAKGTQVVKGFYHSSYDNKNYEFTRAE